MAAQRTDGARNTHVLLLLVACAVTLIISFFPVNNQLRGKNKDYRVWYATGQTVLHGQDIYPTDPNEQFPFIYPTFPALLLAPLAALGPVPLVVVLCLINSAAGIAISLMCVYLATGQALRQHPLLYVLPALIVLPWIWDNFLIGQPNLFLLLLMVGAFVCLRQRRQWPAGVVGAATAIKAFPLMALVYLIYRRYWTAALSMVLFTVFFLVLLPAPFRGFGRNLGELRTWANGMLFNYHADELGQRSGRAYSWNNGSLIALTNRMLRPIDAFPQGRSGKSEDGRRPRAAAGSKLTEDAARRVNVADLNFRIVNATVAGIALALCLAYVLVMPYGRRRTAESDAAEQAMLLLLMLIFSPLLYGYYFVWLWLPLTLVLRRMMVCSRRERVGWIVWSALLLVTLVLNAPQFKLARALGSNIWSALLLLGALGWMLRNPLPPTTPVSTSNFDSAIQPSAAPTAA